MPKTWLKSVGKKLLKSVGLQRIPAQENPAERQVSQNTFSSSPSSGQKSAEFSDQHLDRQLEDQQLEQKLAYLLEQRFEQLIGKKLEQSFAELVRNDPSLVGKFFSAQTDLSYYIQKKPDLHLRGQELPMPPQQLWEGYGDSAEVYLEWGKQHIDNMNRILAEDGFHFAPGQRIMELGCAAGRMLRWLVSETAHSELWGCDLSAEHILWCQQNMSPPFNFLTNTASPNLPFPDNHFDLIYAGSVFTHIGELTDAWLLELRRILRPGGKLYITVHDQNTIHVLQTRLPDFPLAKLLQECDNRTQVTSTNYEVFYINSSPRGGQIVQVFYNMNYFQQKLSRLFSLKSCNEEAYGYQTAVLLQKP